jgi:hypothetical protein
LPFDQFLPPERSPFSPAGEKVADRPDEGAFVERSVLKRPPHPGPLPQFLQERYHMTPRCIRKKLGERGQYGAAQLNDQWRLTLAPV